MVECSANSIRKENKLMASKLGVIDKMIIYVEYYKGEFNHFQIFAREL
jgi:hypothetical protein